MIISYNRKIIEENNLSINEFMAALILMENINIKDGFNSLVKKDLIDDLTGKFLPTQELVDLIEKIILDSDTKQQPEDRLLYLSKSMREIFPNGKKDGTTYYWKGNTNEIIKKLKVFFKKFGDFTDEQILDATKRYVDSFDGQYNYMYLLKYFICKNRKDAAGEIEEVSELYSFIENESQKNSYVDLNSNII